MLRTPAADSPGQPPPVTTLGVAVLTKETTQSPES